MECNGCGENRDVQKIPYIAYEAECARHERAIKRLVWVIVACILLIVLSNAAWLYAWNQYDYEEISYDYSQDGRGINIIGNDNETRQINGAEVEDQATNP